MHPYPARLLNLLGKQDPFVILEDTPRRLALLQQRIGREGLEVAHGPGKWTARQIFAHLADAEIGVCFRIRQVLAGVDQIQPFDQDAWATRYHSADAAAAREAQASLRRWNLALFRSLDATDLARSAFHPERGDQETVDLMIRLLAGHDLNHLAQLETIAALVESGSVVRAGA
jgi:DinB family protein